MTPASTKVTVRVPATTANLGPGFDCLGLTLDLWNEATFKVLDPAAAEVAGLTLVDGVTVSAEGEGAGLLILGVDNLVVRAARALFDFAGAPAPPALHIALRVAVPLASGLGSSASAVVAGLLGANALLGGSVGADDLLRLAIGFEGHPDNVAAALYGGLVVVVRRGEGRSDEEWLAEPVPVAPVPVALAVPDLEYSTTASRAELPTHVALADAVYNMGRTTLVVEALRRGDLELLGKAMDDRLHQARRLEHVPGGREAMAAARAAGAAAVAVSGSGPSLIAFVAATHAAPAVATAMVDALAAAGVRARPLVLRTSTTGAQVTAA